MDEQLNYLDNIIYESTAESTADYTEIIMSINELHTATLDLKAEFVSTHNTLIFLIGAICGIAFGYSFFKGWFRE
ncbi:hypothetical protein D3C77_204990 [compost metagenome]